MGFENRLCHIKNADNYVTESQTKKGNYAFKWFQLIKKSTFFGKWLWQSMVTLHPSTFENYQKKVRFKTGMVQKDTISPNCQPHL